MSLSETIKEAKADTGWSLDDLSAMSSQRDPYRRDTPANRRDAEWVAGMIDAHVGTETVHPRGLHYILVSLAPTKPNGLPYRNTEEDWVWLSEHALTSARWLGAVPFYRIGDNRNAPPIVRIPGEALTKIEAMPHFSMPAAEDLEPKVVVKDRVDTVPAHFAAQPYTLIFAGEKSSLAPVVAPIANRMNAAMVFPTGEMSDGLIWQMVQAINQFDRPAVVFYLSDFDPSGFSMPKNVARKLQAMTTLGHLGEDVTVHATCLTLDQCIELNLPSTPIKATDKRAAKWTAATGRQQTEIDALAALNPEALQQILLADAEPYFDKTLRTRWFQAKSEFEAEQTADLQERIGAEEMAAMRDTMSEKLETIQAEMDALADAASIDADQYDVPDFAPPEAEMPSDLPATDLLLDPEEDWITQTQRLAARKHFEI